MVCIHEVAGLLPPATSADARGHTVENNMNAEGRNGRLIMNADESSKGENVNNLIFEYTVFGGDHPVTVSGQTWHVVDGRLVFRIEAVDTAVFDFWTHFAMSKRAIDEAIRPRIFITGEDTAKVVESIKGSLKRIVAAARETAEPDAADVANFAICQTCRYWGQYLPGGGWGACRTEAGNKAITDPKPQSWSVSNCPVQTRYTFHCDAWQQRPEEWGELPRVGTEEDRDA